MNWRKATILAAIVLLGIALGVYVSLKPADSAWTAANELSKAEAFGFGARGVAARISEDERRFFAILDSPKSHLVFRHVYDTGTPEAKVFAIVGLKQTLLGRGDNRIEDFTLSPEPFESQSGCIVTEGNDPKDLLTALSSDSFRRYVQERR